MNEEKLKTQVSDNMGKCQLRHIKTRKSYITIQIDRMDIVTENVYMKKQATKQDVYISYNSVSKVYIHPN